jgi:hypothetical protein
VVIEREEKANSNRLSGWDLIGYKYLFNRKTLQEDIRVQTGFLEAADIYRKEVIGEL